LRFDDDGGVRFAHKSYSEFFIAQKVYIDTERDPATLLDFCTMQLTKEVLYFLGSFGRDQAKFGKSLVSAIRRTSVSWPDIGSSDNLRDLLYRIAMASGTLLASLSIVGGGISNIEVRKVAVSAAYFRDVHLVDMMINNVDATKWKMMDVYCAQTEIKDSRFEQCELEIKCNSVDVSNTHFVGGTIFLRGQDWRVQDTQFVGCELTFEGKGGVFGGKFSKCPAICFGKDVKFEQGTEMSFSHSTVRGDGLNPWYEQNARLKFTNCFFAGLWLEQTHFASASKCSGVVHISGTSNQVPSVGPPFGLDSNIIVVDVHWFRQGTLAKKQRAAAMDDLAQNHIDDRRYRAITISLESDKKFENYVANIVSEVSARGWTEKIDGGALSEFLV
jgi:hypothetical protein